MLRSEQRTEDTWDLSRLFAADADWDAAYETISKRLPDLEAYSGRLGEGPLLYAACLKEMDAVGEKLDRLYVYAHMKFHQDTTNTTYQDFANRADTLLVAYGAATAYFVPETLALPEETLKAYEADPALAAYGHFMENLRRQKAHTLSPKEEILLAKTEELASAPDTIFAMINDADMQFGTIVNDQGETVPFTKARYTNFLESPDRRVRRDAFHLLYDTYAKQKNTIAATYYASVKKDVFYARVRHYDSALAMALSDDNVPTGVYENLLQTVNAHLPLLHRYVDIRKKALGISDLHMYDLYTPLVPEVKLNIPYARAKEIVAEGLSPLGKAYGEILQEGFRSRWIDVYENEGKRGGAYSWGAYPGTPYVLLNHNDNVNSMFTIAHEMGHALHSYLTWQKQPFHYAGHKIFVAEVASTVNEALLMAHLLKTTTDRNEKLYYLNYYLEQFRGTFFRQAMFAEFEKTTHEMVERGEPLNSENLSTVYYALNKKYFGDGMTVDEKIAMEWARIPHFYNAFYVYQYATGYSAAITLSQKILTEGTPAVEKYLDFLSKGMSEYSIDLLKGAGVDMSTPAPIAAAAAVFGDVLDQIETLL